MCLGTAVLTIYNHPISPPEAKNAIVEGEIKGLNHLGFIHRLQTMVLKVIEFIGMLNSIDNTQVCTIHKIVTFHDPPLDDKNLSPSPKKKWDSFGEGEGKFGSLN